VNWKNSATPPDGDALSRLRQAIRDCAGDERDAASVLLYELAKIEAEGVERGLEALSLLVDAPRSVVRLDQDARRTPWHSNRKRSVLRRISERMRTERATPLTLALASMHGDGRVREEAVAEILKAPHPALIPFLLLRTSCWNGAGAAVSRRHS
jgi:hypothetical protein